MKEKILPFILGAILATGGTIAIQAVAADPGDIIYETGGALTCLTGAQAVCYANCAIADGIWTGVAADVLRVEVFRQTNCDAGKDFGATARGLAYADPLEVPVGSVYRGVVP